MSTRTAARQRALRDPIDILEQLLRTASAYYTHVPHTLTTNRRGRFESGWYREGRQYMPVGPKNIPHPEQQRHQVHMAALALEYADHPRADPALINRSDNFPLSVELRLSISPRSPQMGT